MRISCFGTPDFAVPVFELLHKKQDIVSIITAPDRPAGRGKKIKVSPVKELAIKKNIPILQPTNLKNNDFLKKYYATKPELNVVVAFRMLPKQVFANPKLGSINLHASLLPEYRGAAPINWAIINGETTTGLTTFILDKQIDTGGILLQEKIQIAPKETAGTLYNKMLDIGPKLVLDSIDGIANHSLSPSPQKITQQLKPAPKIFKADTQIDWQSDLQSIDNFVRGLSPYPGAFLSVQNPHKNDTFTLKLFAVNYEIGYSNNLGHIYIKNGSLYISHRQGTLQVLALQKEGRKRMSGEDFLRGTDIDGWKVANAAS